MLKNKKKMRRLEKNTPGYASRAAQTLVLAGALVLGGAVVNAPVLSSDALAAATALEIAGGNGGAGGAGHGTSGNGGGGSGGGGAGAEIAAGTLSGGSLTITGGNAGADGAATGGASGGTTGIAGTDGSVTTLTGWTGNAGAGGAAGAIGAVGVAGANSTAAGSISTGGAPGVAGVGNAGGKGGSGGNAGLKMTDGTLTVDSLAIQGGQGATTASGGNASLLVSKGTLTVTGLTAIGTQATGAANGGSSSLVIDGATGQVNFNDSVTVGAAANSTALLQVGGSANAGVAGTNGSATFKKDLTIAATGKLVIGGTGGAGGAGAGGTGTLNFDGTSTVTGAIVAGGTGGAHATTVGAGGTGNINILSGTTTFANGVTLGGAQGATLATKGNGGAGNLNVLGGATAIFNDVVTVGQANSTASTLKIGGDANGTTAGGAVATATINKKLTVDTALGSLKLGGDGSAASGTTHGAAGGDGVLTLAGADKHAIGSALVLGGAGKDKAAGNGGNGGAGTLILEQDADFAAVTLGGAGGAGAGAGIEGKGGKGTIFVKDGVTAALAGNLAVGGQAANGGNGELVIDNGGIVTVVGTSNVGDAVNGATGTVSIDKTGKLVQGTAANVFTINKGTVTAHNYKSANTATATDYGLVSTKVSLNGADAVLKLMGDQTISKLQIHGTNNVAGIEVANGTLAIDGKLTLTGTTATGDTHGIGNTGVLQAQTLATGVTTSGVYDWTAGTLKLMGDGKKDTVVLDAVGLTLSTANSNVTFAAADAAGGGTYKGAIAVNAGLMTFGKGDWSVHNATNTGTVDVATTATGANKGLLVTGGGNLTVDRLWLTGNAKAVIGDGANASVLTVAGNTTTLNSESFKNPTDSAINVGIEVKNLSSLKVKYEQVLKDNALVAAADGKIKVNPGAMLYLDGSPTLNATQVTALKGLLLGGKGLLNLGGANLGLTDEELTYANVNGITSDSLLTKSMKLTGANALTGVSGGFGSLTITDAVAAPLGVDVNSTLILTGGAQGTQLVNANLTATGNITLAVAADQVLTFGNQLTATAPTHGTLTGDVSLAAGATGKTTFNAVNGTFGVTGSLNVLGDNTLTNVSNAALTVKSIVNTGGNTTAVNVTGGSLNVTSGAATVGAVRLDGGMLINTDESTQAAPTNGDLTVGIVTTASTADGAVNILSAGNDLKVASFTDGTTTGKISNTLISAGKDFTLTAGNINAANVGFDIVGTMDLSNGNQTLTADQSAFNVGGELKTGNGSIALSASEGSVGRVTTGGELKLTKGSNITLSEADVTKASSVNNLVVGEKAVAAVANSGSAANLDVKGKLSMATGEIYNGSTVTVNELDATGLVRVGSTDDMAGSSLIINTLTANSTGTFFVDPAGANSLVQLKDTTTPLTQDFIAGNNGIVSFGQHGMDWAKTQIAASGMTNPSVLVMASAVTLDAGAQILVGDKYQSDGSWITPGAPDTFGLAIRGNSLVIVDAANWEADTAGITLNGSVGSVERNVLIEKSIGLRLHADNLKANESRTLVSGINDAYQTAGGSVLGDNTTLELGKTSTNYMLIGVDDVVYNTGTGSTGFITAGTRLIHANSVLPNLSNSMGNLLDGMAISTGFNSNSSSAGIRFVSRALDRRYLGENNARLAAATIEGAAQMGAVAGVQISTIGAANAASGAVTTRTSFAQPLMDMSKAVAVHQDVDGALSLDNGLSAGNGMKNGLGVWIMPLYQSNRTWGHKAENFKSGMSSDLGGIALGADYTIDDMFRFGAAFNVGGGYAESDGDFNKTDNRFNFWGVNLYGGWSMNNFGLSADVGYTSNYNKVEQDTPMALGLSNLKSDITSSALTAGLKGEYKFETSVVDIIPHIGVRYMGLTTDSYDVKSGGTVFAVEQDFQSIWTFPIGVAFNKTITTDSGWMFKPQIDLSVIPAVGDIKAKSKSKIPGVPGSAEMKMQVVDDVTFDGGVGLEMGKDNLSFGINYNLQASEHRTGHGVFGTLRYEF